MIYSAQNPLIDCLRRANLRNEVSDLFSHAFLEQNIACVSEQNIVSIKHQTPFYKDKLI